LGQNKVDHRYNEIDKFAFKVFIETTFLKKKLYLYWSW